MTTNGHYPTPGFPPPRPPTPDEAAHARAAALLAADEAAFRRMADVLPQILWIADTSGRVIFCNRYWYDYTGQDEATTLDNGWLRAIHPEDQPGVLAQWTAAVQAGHPYQFDYRLRATDNTYRWFGGRSFPVQTPGGANDRWLGIADDIDQRKRLEAEVQHQAELHRQEQERLSAILDRLPVGVFIATGDPAQRTMQWQSINSVGQQQITLPRVTPGVTAETFTVYHPDGRLYDEADLPIQRGLWHGEAVSGQIMVFRYHDGTERIFEATTVLLADDPAGRVVIEVLQEITEHTRLKDQVLRQAELLQTVFAIAPVGMALYDSEMHLIDGNAEWVRQSGFDPTAARGRHITEYSPVGRERAAMYAQVLAGQAIEVENLVYTHPHTGETGYYDVRYRPVRDAGGAIVGLLSSSVDVTAYRELNRQKDEFFSIASHELRGPITTLKGFAQLGLRNARRGDTERMAHTLTMVDQQANRLTRLVDDLLDISRITIGQLVVERQPLDLRALAEETVRNTALGAPDFRMTAHLPVAPVPVRGDRIRLEQVLTNLLQNAIKYSRDRREALVTLTTGDGEARLAVQDFGVGIPADQQAAVFNRYFRARNVTEGAAPGLGLGLFISQGIAAAHGGRLDLHSTEGVGSTFTLVLPLADERLAE